MRFIFRFVIKKRREREKFDKFIREHYVLYLSLYVRIFVFAILFDRG